MQVLFTIHFMYRGSLFLRLTFFLITVLWSVSFAAFVGPPVEAMTKVKEVLTSESTPQDILEAYLEKIQTTEDKLKETLPEKEKAELEALLLKLNKDLEDLLAGKESVSYFQPQTTSLTLQEELMEIFKPLIGEIKSATADSRDKENLRNQIELLQQKDTAIQAALNRIRSIIEDEKKEEKPSDALIELLTKRLSKWQDRQQTTHLELESYILQLEEKNMNSRNAVESASRVIANFFKSRGVHLILAILIALFVWFAIHVIYKRFVKFSPIHNKKFLHATAHAIDGTVALVSVIVSIVSLVLTFFIFDDWVLLSGTLLVFLGIFWAFRDKLPDLAEEVRLIVNAGSVRQGELLIFEGLTWYVEKIRIYAYLTNPKLEGGLARIPIKKIVGLHSRPAKYIERYFPTSINDWVLLADGTYGKVLHQTPEYVELVKLGGSRKTYPTADFLAQSPENLSEASFRLHSPFGIDYKHQALATTEIREILCQELTVGFSKALPSPELLQNLKVEFASAGASSLDFTIIIDFKGDLAHKYNELFRLSQKLAVEACNKHGWEIPFTQITVHQANG